MIILFTKPKKLPSREFTMPKKMRVGHATAMLIVFALILICSLILTLIFGALTEKKDTGLPSSIQIKTPTVVIDAGHGGEDGGASAASGILEKDLNLSVAKKLSDLFRAAGYETVMTRNEDKLLYDPSSDYEGRKKILDMRERVRIVSSCSDPIFVSIHMNAFPEERYSGFQVYYSSNCDLSLSLAQKIQETVISFVQPENNRRAKCGRDIFLLDRIKAPAVLLECGFLSNKEEAALLSDEKYQNELVFFIFHAIVSEIQ